MASNTAILNHESEKTIYVKISFTGLVHSSFYPRLFKYDAVIKAAEGYYPDETPDEFVLSGTEKENVYRRFEADFAIGAIDPLNYPDWKVMCELFRKNDDADDDLIISVEESGKFGGSNVADPNITIYLSRTRPA